MACTLGGYEGCFVIYPPPLGCSALYGFDSGFFFHLTEEDIREVIEFCYGVIIIYCNYFIVVLCLYCFD